MLRRAALQAGLALLLLSLPALAQNAEYQVKAAYLYNFSKFVKWPAGARPATAATFQICVLGTNPFGRTLEATVAEERLDNKKIVARRISSAAEAAECAIVFVPRTEQSRFAPLLPELARQGSLTVGEGPRFSERGGMIGFVMDGDRVRFEVNLAAAQKAGLTLSSELLKVATEVRMAEPKGGGQ